MTDSSTPADVPAIEIRNLSQSFGERWAVRNASFEVAAGSLHGFVGPNGAGKTTTLKIVCTLLEPQTGLVRVFGKDVALKTQEVRRRIGFMPDHFSMYRRMSVFEYLDFFGAAYGMTTVQRDRSDAKQKGENAPADNRGQRADDRPALRFRFEPN